MSRLAPGPNQTAMAMHRFDLDEVPISTISLQATLAPLIRHWRTICDNYFKRDFCILSSKVVGGRRSPAVACWASDHWVASSNPLRGMFRH